ncbi:MAG: ABC transporter permease, partial [Nitrososphaera sp.]
MLEEKTQLEKQQNRFDVTDAANIALFLAAFVGIWQLVFMLGVWPESALPSPVTVLGAIWSLTANSSLPIGIGITLLRLVAGFAISIAIGVGVGLV